MFTSNVTTANPGNLVIPLTAVFDQLDGKLSAADLNALLVALVSKRNTEVRPGDLITAELINGILSDLNDFNIRLLKLEATAPPTKQTVMVVSPTASTALRIGDPLILKGSGLLPDSLVLVDGQPLGGGVGSPDNQTLTFRSIPALDIQGGLPTAGKSVELLVSNELGGFKTGFILKPILITKPVGSVVIALMQKPDTSVVFKPEGIYTYKFKISADTKPDLRFDVDAGVGIDSWNVTPSQKRIFVPQAQGGGVMTVVELTVTVVIPKAAKTGDTGKLLVQLTALEDANFVWQSSGDEEIKVDASPTQLDTVNLTLMGTFSGNATIRTNPTNGTFTSLIGKSGGSGGTGTIDIKLTRVNGVLPAGDYQVDLDKLGAFPGDSTPPKWSASITGATNGRINLSGNLQPLPVQIVVQQGAPKAKFVVGVVNSADKSIFGSATFDVEIRV